MPRPGPGLHHVPMLAGLKRALNVAFPLVLGIGIVVLPAIPRKHLPEPLAPVRERLDRTMRTLSLSQRWGMYAPNPVRSHSHPRFVAVDPDGTERVLLQDELTDDPWGRAFWWTKSREDFWRYHAVHYRAKARNPHRTWYLLGLCVEEARAGHHPERITLYRLRRSFRRPDKVAEGKTVLIKRKRKVLQSVRCDSKTVREMIEEDERGAGADAAG